MLRLAALAFALFLTACTDSSDVEGPQRDLGDFQLGHNVVVASKAVQGPLSRPATEEEWNETLSSAITERFGRYQGDKLYHLGVSVEGYVIAAPGIPLVLSPKSILIVNVTLWDDDAGKKINEKPKQITVFESFSPESAVVGSGYTTSREEQMRNLAQNAAKEIQNWLLENREWFGDAPMPRPLPGRSAAPAPGQIAQASALPAGEVAAQAQ